MTEFEKKVAELNLDRSNWKLVKFDDVAIQQKQKVDRENTDLTRYVKGEHMHSEDLHLREWGELTDEYLGPAFIRKFEQGDILYGSRRTYLRKVVLAPFEGITSNTTFVVKANEQKIDKRLLPFIMLSEGFSQHSIKNSKGSVNPYVNWKDLAGYDFLLPSKSQQEEIANLLWSIDNVIETRNETLNQLTLVYLTKLESELLDKNSEKVSFSDLGDVIRGVGYKPDELIKDYSNDACIVLRANNIKDSNINFDNINILDMKHIKSNQILQDGDFAICMSNGSKDLVGKAAELENVLKNVAVGSFCAAFRPNSEENRMLLKHLFSSASYRMSVKRTLSGSTINNLKPSDIESMFFRVNAEKSKDIIYDLDSLMLGEKKLKTEIHTLKQLQKSIINQVF